MDDLKWASVFKLAASTGVFTVILNLVINASRDWWREKRRNKTEAAFLALRLAVILEKFVSSCVYRTWHDSVNAREGRELSYKLPELAAYPPDAPEWKSFHERNSQIVDQILSLPNEITSAEMRCEFAGIHEGNGFASADETVVAGIKAWTLAKALRKNNHLQPIIIVHIDNLENEYKKLQVRTEFNTAFEHFAGVSTQ